jgi:localization factor PodJL
MKILIALLLAGCVATAAQAAPTNPAAVNEFKSQLTLASKGDREAQYRVGEMYEKGLGTDPDMPLAIIWYGRASQQGDNRAAERLSALDRSNTREVKEKEQSRVDSVMKALRQQESDEAVRTRASREKVAADKAAAETRARQQAQAQAQDATARAREKAAADAAAARARSELAKPAPVSAAKPAPVPAAKPAETPKKESADGERAEFSSNPCKGPQAKFLSTCQ